ncbi:hypothetical protein GC197_14885 [bacterium]|nr:hypothetical protein [bacterium]
MKTYALLTAAAAIWLSLVGASSAADFQVTTQVYRGNERSPVVTYQTIFKGAKVYDVVTTPPRQATIIDFDTGQLTLLDPQRQVKLTMSTQNVLQRSAFFKTHGRFPDQPLWQFLKDPSFQTNYDPQTQVLKMEGDPLSYEADLQPVSAQPTVDAYARFCDWSAQLNFICAASDLPQARIELNNQIRSRGALPTQVHKTVRYADPTKTISLRSMHQYRWKANADDEKLIQLLETDLTKARAVDFDEFVRPAFSTAQK